MIVAVPGARALKVSLPAPISWAVTIAGSLDSTVTRWLGRCSVGRTNTSSSVEYPARISSSVLESDTLLTITAQESVMPLMVEA